MSARTMALCLLVLCAAGAWGAEAPAAPGKIEAVTLYREQALVTRVVSVEAPAGRVELVVGDLPEHVVADSLFAEAGPGLEVRAVRYRTHAVGEEPREAVRKLDADIEAAEARLARNRKMTELTQQRQGMLDKLTNFVAPTATVEMSKGVLNTETLKNVTLFEFEQHKLAAEEGLTLAAEAKEIEKQIALLRKQRGELTAVHSREVREAVLFLDKAGPGAAQVRLSYQTSGAGWSPSYNFRADKDGKEVRVEYNALVHQQSGEDWNGVALTLSTASPALASEGPGLAPFRVALARVEPPQTVGQAQPNAPGNIEYVQGNFFSNTGKMKAAEASLRQSVTYGGNTMASWAMNTAAGDNQFLEIESSKEVLKQVFQESAVQREPSVSYPLAAPVSVASRSDQQLVRISEMKLEGKLYYVASPVLSSYVYRETELTNTAIDALLAGPVSAYLDGRFVGRGEVPSVARGETFVVGFGADGQLRTRRELVDKSDSIQGGNREMNFKYRLVIENFKDTPASVRLQDRIPVAQRETDVRITLPAMADKVSEDKVYLRVERPKGILRWEVEVPAKAAGEKAKMVEYSYRLELDRNMRLTAFDGARNQELLDEFRQLQLDQRLKRK